MVILHRLLQHFVLINLVSVFYRLSLLIKALKLYFIGFFYSSLNFFLMHARQLIVQFRMGHQKMFEHERYRHRLSSWNGPNRKDQMELLLHIEFLYDDQILLKLSRLSSIQKASSGIDIPTTLQISVWLLFCSLQFNLLLTDIKCYDIQQMVLSFNEQLFVWVFKTLAEKKKGFDDSAFTFL